MRQIFYLQIQSHRVRAFTPLHAQTTPLFLKSSNLIFAQDAVHCAVELRFQIQYRIQRMKGSFYVLLSHIFPKEGY